MTKRFQWLYRYNDRAIDSVGHSMIMHVATQYIIKIMGFFSHNPQQFAPEIKRHLEKTHENSISSNALLHSVLINIGIIYMKDHNHVNFSEEHEMNYHLELVNKSKSKENRNYLRENTQWRAKKELDKTVLTHDEFKPYVEADKIHLSDPV
ncbi:hypothetical protein [Vibrio rhizosphaerae]|uniref:hypothetical protein n=1 Tax=Vibrio rhizosphaerae TaxID=398736 RepID=UPI001FE21686|nr:hypothetical protein [Vibrio rhizosphaerae]